jgi:far upstream element-binding protein
MNSDECITEEILVPGYKCGLIIGKGGETIKKLQEKSDTKMQLIQNSYEPSEQEKPLQITGPPERVELAKRMINQLLESDDNRMSKGAATGVNQIQMNQGVSTIGIVIVPRTAVGFIIGRGGETIKRIASESGAYVQFEQDDGSNELECRARIGGSKSQVAHAASIIEELVNRSNAEIQKTSFTMIVPIAKTGLVIGKGGEVIKKINLESGARVDLSRDSPVDAVNNLFVIRGDPHQIESAKQAILAQISDKNGDAPISTVPAQDEHPQGTQSQWAPANAYDQGQQVYDQNSSFAQPASYDQSSFGSSQPLSTQQQYSGSQQNYGGQIQQPINPTSGQTDYTSQWIDYYLSMGMHDKAAEVERLRASQNRQ